MMTVIDPAVKLDGTLSVQGGAQVLARADCTYACL